MHKELIQEDLISVIVPVYNVEKYLNKCVDSILKQSYKKFELILIDDGSTDLSGKICDEYALKDKRVQVIHKKNGGLSSARNKGIEICNGKSLCFIDSDDYIHPEMLERLYVELKNSDAELVICGFECVFEENYKGQMKEDIFSIIECETMNSDEAIEKLFEKNGWQYVVAWNKLYQKELFKDIRYPEGLIHEDEMVIHRVLGQCKKIVTVSDCLYYYRQRENSIMSQKNNIKRMDYYLALADRINYLNYTQRKKRVHELVERYWREILWKYKMSFCDETFREYFKKVHKSFRKILFIILKELDSSWKEKISIIIFAINPEIYMKIWR